MSKKIWPAFFKADGTLLPKEEFQKKIHKIINLDIRSLYPTAQTAKQPVLNPLLLSTCTKEDADLMNSYGQQNAVFALNDPCQSTRASKRDEDNLFLVPVNNKQTPYHRCEKYRVIEKLL